MKARRSVLMMTGMLALLTLAVVGPRGDTAGASTNAYVTLCSHTNYLGPCYNFAFDLSDLRLVLPQFANVNDQASSLIFGQRGLVASVYRDINYGGACETFAGQDPDLSNNAIGSKTISSLRMTECNPGENYVLLCQDINYGGRCQSFAEGIFTNLGDYFIGNDTVSSIKVPLGYNLVIFEKSDCTGRTGIFSKGASNPDLRFASLDLFNWNDKISAIKVLPSWDSSPDWFSCF